MERLPRSGVIPLCAVALGVVSGVTRLVRRP